MMEWIGTFIGIIAGFILGIFGSLIASHFHDIITEAKAEREIQDSVYNTIWDQFIYRNDDPDCKYRNNR